MRAERLSLRMGLSIGAVSPPSGDVSPPAGPFSNHATLGNDLVSYWKFDEVSGTRYDSVVASANDLTDNNTVGNAPNGPSGSVASFVHANSEFLSHSGVPFKGNQAFTVAGWIRVDNTGAAYGAIGRDGVNRDWSIIAQKLATTDSFTFYHLAGGFPNVSANSYAHGIMHFVVASIDGSGGTMSLSVDNQTPVTTTAATFVDVASVFTIGGTPGSGDMDGLVGRVGFWAGALTPTLITSLFNNGNGKSYSELTAAEKVGLVSYWNLDEVNGDRADSHGSNTLTDNNTVLSVHSGPVGTVAKFVAANTEALTKTSVSAGVGVGGLSVSAWIISNSNNYIILHNGNYGIDYNWDFYIDAGFGLQFRIWDGSGSIVSQSTGQSVTTGTWHHILGWWDPADGKAHATIDGIALTAGASVSAPTHGAKTMSIGAFSNNIGAPSAYAFDGNIGRVGVWSRVLNSGERTSIFNSGIGKSYSDLTTAEKVNLVSYWNLDEVSGSRADSHGSNTLTDNNTVTSVVNAGGAMRNVAARFVAASNESLSLPGFTNTVSFTYAGWFKNPALPSNETLLAHDGGTWPQDYSISLYSAAGDTIQVRCGDGVAGVVTQVTPVTVGSWHLFIVWVDDADKVLRLQIDNGTVAASAAMGGSVVTPTATLFIGDSPEITSNWNGEIDELGYWSRSLTAPERTDLWNSGAGLFY